MAKSQTPQWTTGLLKITFGLTEIVENYPLLDEWIGSSEEKITLAEQERLDVLRLRLLKNFRSWNEETLKMKFISPLLELIDYDFGDFQSLFDAEMKGVVDKTELKCITDFMLAKTVDDVIQTPYFYFHEYKRKKNNSDDPIAQVLIPSLIAETLNEEKFPIYGCHVIGEMWYFMIVNGREYAIAKGIDATDNNGLMRIFLILRKVRTSIINQLKNHK